MSNSRGLKTRKALLNAIRMDVYAELKKLSDETKIPMSKLLDEAVENLISKKKPAK